MDGVSIGIFVALIAGLILFIVKGVGTSTHTVRNEMHTHLTGLRADVQQLAIRVAELRGAGEERAALVDLLAERLKNGR